MFDGMFDSNMRISNLSMSNLSDGTKEIMDLFFPVGGVCHKVTCYLDKTVTIEKIELNDGRKYYDVSKSAGGTVMAGKLVHLDGSEELDLILVDKRE